MTFLTTAKMNPALAARVEKAVTGRNPRKSVGPRLIAMSRIAFVLLVGITVYAVLIGRRRAQEELGRARASLVDDAQAKAAMLRPEETEIVGRSGNWVAMLAADGPDEIAPELRAPDGLAKTMARPMVYVRGPINSFSSKDELADSAGRSAKDAFVLCMLEPPRAREEKELLDHVRVAYAGGGKLEGHTTNVRRLDDAILGLPYLEPAWRDHVRGLDEPNELAHLRSAFDHAPLARAIAAAKSEVLLIVLDEPGDSKAVTELDGEKPHAVRVGIVDLHQSKILLRMKKSISPEWITPSKRPSYALGLDSCALAFDVQESLKKR